MTTAGDDEGSGPADSAGGAGSGAHPDAAPADPGHVGRPATSLLTWATVSIVVLIAIVLVVIKVTGTSTTSTPPTPPTPAPSAVVQAITHVPAAVYDSVGIASPDAAVSPPTILGGQAALAKGSKPEVLLVTDEFCPYCAAEAWAVVAALSRFGTFTGLDTMQSASNEPFPGTPAFAFLDTKFSSRFVSADIVERYGVQKNAAGTGYAALQPLSAAQRALLARDDPATPGAPGGLLPFLDIDNRAVTSGGSFSPSIFQQLSSTDIGAGLKDAKDPATEAIVATANYLSAVICSVDGQEPARVCSSPGVGGAASALHLGP